MLQVARYYRPPEAAGADVEPRPLAYHRAAMAPRPEAAETDAQMELQHVLVLFRHGDRSPISRRVGAKLAMAPAETDFWAARLADLSVVGALNSGTRVVALDGAASPPPQQGGRWPCGQLTAAGIEMMRRKGRLLRERYAALLQDVDPEHELHVQSTNIRRTIHSAQSLLAGLFPEYFVHADAGNALAASERLQPDSRSFLAHVQTDRLRKKDGELLIHADDANGLAPQHSYELYRDLAKMLADELRLHAPPGFAEASQRVSEIIGAGSSKLVAWTGCE
ncbi:unnamed protein product [Phytophthora lilii]|uniref:Unnamed protein product n=1 Tax=Phytophthora lilii TaxID=2077276 RepID=A0A9W6TID0_9STRA|nr:unnamed protein product [Phytophthora lilii]